MSTVGTQSQARVRDPRLDFFRGIAMYIILIAHTPGNAWTLWIPARWGYSDATEMFVFCSGMASAIAFGKAFQYRGLALGTTRIAFRVWQVYWCHIGLFMFVAMSVALFNHYGFEERDYVGQLNLYPFFENAQANLIGLLTLTYVPNYFDILPMYLVILGMIPIVMGLARVHLGLVAGLVLVLWAWANVEVLTLVGIEGLEPLQLPAQLWFEPPNNTRGWFFNPFGWQLLFFTGFAFMVGWLPAPPVRWWLIGLASTVVVVMFCFSHVAMRELGFDWAREWRIENRPLLRKTSFGILRYTHFLALAYLAWVAVGPMGKRLSVGRLWTTIVGVIRKVGQQSLAVFVLSMALARYLGLWLDEIGRNWMTVPMVNLTGILIVTLAAYGVAWIRTQPWRGPAREPARPVATIEGRTA